MALTQTQVSALYVAIFNRASEGEGNTYWQNTGLSMAEMVEPMLATEDAKIYFGDSLSSNQAFIEHIYQNTLNKTVTEDADGIKYWVDLLEAGKSRGEVVAGLVEAATKPENAGEAQDQFNNRVAVSDYTAETLEQAPLDYKQSLGFGDELPVTNDTATVQTAEANVKALASTVTLTANTDIKSAGIFDAPMVYTPDGSDRILSLQDEDTLTGLGDSATLNATLGNINADEGTNAIITPTLENIKTVNTNWTGNVTTLDLRNADSVENLNVDQITAAGSSANFANISSDVGDMDIANIRDNGSSVSYDYVRGILKAEDNEANIALNNLLLSSVTITSNSTTAEGFETVNINALNGVNISGQLNIAQMDNLNITGSDFLDIVSLTPTAPVSSPEYDLLGATGIANPGSAGLRTINASEFTGDLTIDISAALGRSVDPENSGAPFYGETTGGKGDDKFYTSVSVAGDDAADNGHNIIDGGEGTNVLVSTVGNIVNDAEIKNIQTLELRDQGAMTTVDMDAFDENLTSVFMRDEDAGATTFDLNDVTKAQAESALTLAHDISTGGGSTVDVALKDATGADDTVTLTVVNDLNTGNTFNYTLTAVGTDTDGIAANVNTGIAITSDADAVENITIHDNDTESNTVTLTNIINHTGKITLDGGTAGNTFTVAGTLNSETIDASAQASDLRLTVGDTVGTITTTTQDIKLGTGDDVLTYANIDELDATDSLTDAGGNDTVRAAFSKDSSLSVADIENLHVTSTDSVTLGMGSADVTNLVILANTATNADTDLDNNGVNNMNIAGSGVSTNIITLDNSSLTQLNFFGDADNTVGQTASVIGADDNTVHTFNGVTLTNNSATNITANINTSLDINNTGINSGAASYTIGQITTHGNTGMDIVVGNERVNAGTTTTINNIYAKNMATLTATATGNLALGTVSGAPLNNSLKLFDMSNVGGNVTANVISLGDNAIVKLADGDHTFSALNSAGKNINITSGNGDSTITGTAQNDTITTGSGNDTVAGDRGDNVITTGAGDDAVTAKNGSDTVDLGTGTDTFIDNLGSGINASLATNTVSMSGGSATVNIDVDGSGGVMVAGTDIDQMLAVGTGSDLTISWLGNTIASATLDGTVAQTIVGGAATTAAATAGSDLTIITTGGVETVAASAGNDVTIFTGSVAGTDGLNFSGGTGNDSAVGTVSVDAFNGGTGADIFVMADVAGGDVNSDRVVISDGDSKADAWDQIALFDAVTVATGNVAAVVGTATAGADVLDLDSQLINTGAGQAITTAVASSDGLAIETSFTTTATGLFSYDGGTTIGTAATQISLADTLSLLAVELNGTGETVVFEYDNDGVAGSTVGDSTFVFQDGVNDTVIELVNTTGVTGLETAGTGTGNTIDIA